MPVIIVTLCIIALYAGIISLLIYLLSLIPLLGITIDSWLSLSAFSLCIIIWIIPYVLLSIVQVLPFRNRLLKGLVDVLYELISTALFTIYVLFLDKHFSALSFSNSGIVSIVITIILLTLIIDKTGNLIDKYEGKEEQ